jgi:hypothetical protein
MCVHTKLKVDALVVFHMLPIGEHLGPRLTKYIRLQLLLATLMTNCMYLCQCMFSVVEILGGCHLDFLLHACCRWSDQFYMLGTM